MIQKEDWREKANYTVLTSSSSSLLIVQREAMLELENKTSAATMDSLLWYHFHLTLSVRLSVMIVKLLRVPVSPRNICLTGIIELS